MKGNDFKKLSKTVAHALRHEPELYGLQVDHEGWTNLFDLQNALQRFPAWRRLRIEDILYMNRTSPKERFEVKGDKIRALYGHSFEGKVEKTAATPPEYLYHGTSPDVAREILTEGLNTMNRHYVHLSLDKRGAYNVGRRKAYYPAILRISAKQASEDGINFYIGNDIIWLADSIPAQYITIDAE
jgi:putative RNA 2'-phosphotransferase